MKFLTILLLLLSLNSKSQKLIISCDTMFKVRYSSDLYFHEAVKSEKYEVVKFNTRPKKIVLDFKKEQVKIRGKKYKIEIALEENYPFYYIDVKRKKQYYELFIFDDCLGGIGVFLKDNNDFDIVALYFPNVQVSKIINN